MKTLHLAAAGLMFCGWAVYLAGVADTNALCVKVGKGDLTTSDLLSSGPDSPDKSFMPLNNPWALPITTNSLLGGRKMLSTEEAAGLFPSHRRMLMGVTQDRCGWTYSFYWWTVALQGLATILALLVGAGALASVKHVVGPLLYVNTALLCAVAADVWPYASEYAVTKTKGKWPSAIAVTAAGLIITLVANFAYFFADKPAEELAPAVPAEAK